MMSRNVRGFMSLFWSEKPVRLQGARLLRRRRHRHGAVLGPARGRGPGEDRLSAGPRLGGADDGAVGAPDRPRPRQAAAAHRRLDHRAREAVEWGLATEAAPAAELDARFEVAARAGRAAADQPARDAQAARQPGGRLAGPATRPRCWAPFFDGIARHTPEGYDFVRRAAEGGFKQAVRERDEPFGDFGLDQARDSSEGPDHQLADAVRARHGAPARRRRPRGLRRRRLRASPRAATRKYLAGHFVYPSPRDETEAFIDELERIVAETGIDVIVPAFEEAFYISTQRERLSAVGDDLRRPVRGARARCTTRRPSSGWSAGSACRSRRPSSPPRTPSSPRRSSASTATSPAPCSRAAASTC